MGLQPARYRANSIWKKEHSSSNRETLLCCVRTALNLTFVCQNLFLFLPAGHALYEKRYELFPNRWEKTSLKNSARNARFWRSCHTKATKKSKYLLDRSCIHQYAAL